MTQLHLPIVTSILSQLAVKHPDSRDELMTLRRAVVQWAEEVNRTIEDKNKQIMSAKTKGNEKLDYLLKDIEQNIQTMARHYKDPGLQYYQNRFEKIREEFDLAHIDFSRFDQNRRAAACQTDPREQLVPGFDVNKLIQRLKEKENETRELEAKIRELQDQIQYLRNRFGDIEAERSREEAEYAEKLDRLRSLLETTKKNDLATVRSPPLMSYRSLNDCRKFPTENSMSEEMNRFVSGPDIICEETEQLNEGEMRVIMCQALALEGILESISQHNS